QRDPAELKIVDQFFQVERAIRVFVGMYPKLAIRANGEVALAPTGNVIEIRSLGCSPAIGRFAHRGAVSEYGCHEISVSFDLTLRARGKFMKFLCVRRIGRLAANALPDCRTSSGVERWKCGSVPCSRSHL